MAPRKSPDTEDETTQDETVNAGETQGAQVLENGDEDKDGAPPPATTNEGDDFMGSSVPLDPALVDPMRLDNVTEPTFKLEDLPDGAIIDDLTGGEGDLKSASVAFKPAPRFNDEFVGQGGRFAVHPVTGERMPVYEKYTDEEGNVQYRKAA